MVNIFSDVVFENNAFLDMGEVIFIAYIMRRVWESKDKDSELKIRHTFIVLLSENGTELIVEAINNGK